MPLKEFNIKRVLIKKLINAQTQKYDNIINLIVPIKRARLLYRNFGILVSN
jgi:hypothetical protein